MTDVVDTMTLRIEFEPGLADYRRRVLATVLGQYPGVLMVEVLDPRPVSPPTAQRTAYKRFALDGWTLG